MKLLPPHKMLEKIRTGSSSWWSKQQELHALELFRAAAQRVPAYKKFLCEHAIDPDAIQTFADLQKVPPTSKQNYLRQYPMQELLWEGEVRRPFVFAATSGSTGKPFYFPHGRSLVEEYSVLLDLYLENHREQGPTLILVCFGMGVWIGGVFTFQALEMASERGRNLSVLTPGLNKGEIFHALRDLAPNFKRTILVGYPPFIKDILDEARMENIDLNSLGIRLLFAAESFNETFRDHVCALAGIDDPVLDTLNIYGTADIGAMAFETPTAIHLRRRSMEHQHLFRSLFGSIDKTPTLAQFNPLWTSFEAPDGEILLTGDNAIPLIRYAIGDKGGVMTYKEAMRTASRSKVLLDEDVPQYELPFVYVYERTDFAVKLSGAIVYPEPVRDALQEEELQKFVTGRFTMLAHRDEKQDPYLQLHVELRRDISPSTEITERVIGSSVRHLLQKNSEYRAVHTATPERATPRVTLWKHEDPTYFPSGVKQKWVVKDA